MVDNMTELRQDNRKLIPASIAIIAVAVIVLNFLFIWLNHTLIFDPLFYVPIILTAYYYPKRGVVFALGAAVLYLAMVLAEFHQSMDIVITGLGHACFFIIIGFVLTYLSIWSPHELKIYKNLADSVDPSRIKTTIIPACIVIMSATIFFLNFLVLQTSGSVIFDPLFYFPIIIVAYFYPRKTVIATAALTTLYFAMVMIVPQHSPEVVTTSIGHAGLFIIIGFVDAYLSMNLSREPAIHKRFAEIVESSSDAISGTTLDGIITDWNKGAERLYGYTAGEVTGRSVSLLVPPDRTDEIYLMLNRIQQGELVKGYETEQMTKGGAHIFVSLTVSPLRNDSGMVIGSSTIAHDITERKRMEEALRESDERYRQILENSPLGMVLVSPDFRFVSVNPAWVSMTGYPEEELLRMSFEDITHPDHPAGDREDIRKLAAGTIPVYDTERRYIRKDGSILWGLLKVTTIRDQQGALRFFSCQIEDITERKLAEEALASANKKLNLMNNITRHDIRNQLHALRIAIDLIDRNHLDPETRKLIGITEKAAETINGQIEFTKEYENIGVNTPIWQDCRTLIDTAARQAPLGNVTLISDLPAGTEVFADPMIVKVFYNLIDNAVRYGEKITAIRFSAEESGDNHLILCEDDGNGIPPDEKERIFDRGFGRNTGIGLFLSREILDITGITIQETGTYGEGARFEIKVPSGRFRLAPPSANPG
jgi:PAS domain S-box-containing protein